MEGLGLQPLDSDPELSASVPPEDNTPAPAPAQFPVRVKLSDGSWKRVIFAKPPSDDDIDEAVSNFNAKLKIPKPAIGRGAPRPGDANLDLLQHDAAAQAAQNQAANAKFTAGQAAPVTMPTPAQWQAAGRVDQASSPGDLISPDLHKDMATVRQMPGGHKMLKTMFRDKFPTTQHLLDMQGERQTQAQMKIGDALPGWLDNPIFGSRLMDAWAISHGGQPNPHPVSSQLAGLGTYPTDVLTDAAVAMNLGGDATAKQRALATINVALKTLPPDAAIGVIGKALRGARGITALDIAAKSGISAKYVQDLLDQGGEGSLVNGFKTEASASQPWHVAPRGTAPDLASLSQGDRFTVKTPTEAPVPGDPLRPDLVDASGNPTVRPVVEPPAETQAPQLLDRRGNPVNAGPPAETAPAAPLEPVADAGVKPGPPPVLSESAPGVRTRADALADIERLDAANAGRLGGMTSKRRGAASVGPEDFSYALQRGKLLVEAGFRGFAEWSQEMVSKLGGWVKPKLQELYKSAHDLASDPVSRLSRAIRDAGPVQADWAASSARQRGQQAARGSAALSAGSGEAGHHGMLGAMKGTFERPAFEPVRGQIAQADVDHLFNMIRDHPGLRTPFEKANAGQALGQVLKGELPAEGGMNLLAKVFGPDLVDTLLKKRSAGEKVLSGVGKYQRFNLLSSPAAFFKLGSATAGHAFFSPIEEGLQAGLKRAPGMGGLVEKAGYEAAGSLKAEGKAARELVSPATLRDVFQKLRTGKNSLDVLYAHTTGLHGTTLQEAGKSGFADIFNRIHGAMKTPLQRSAFARSLEKQLGHLEARGSVPTPEQLLSVHAQAYADSLQAILRNDNALTSAWQDLLGHISKNGPGGKAAAAGLRTVNPIAGVATNFAGRSAEYVGGIPYGLLRTVLAHGAENMSQAEAAAVLRAYKRGGVGAGLIALGYAQPAGWLRVGGHYSPDHAKSSSELKDGEVEVFGVKLPPILARAFLHAPMMQALEVGADAANYDTRAHGARAALGGLVENLPLADAAQSVTKAFTGSENEAGKATGRYVSGFVPLGGAARALGDYTDDTKRSPKGFRDELSLMFPWWQREGVPAKKIKP